MLKLKNLDNYFFDLIFYRNKVQLQLLMGVQYFNMTFDLIGMILYTPHYAISSLLNALGAYRELTAIALISVLIRILGSSIESIYAVNTGMLMGVTLNFILTASLFLYYKHKYKVPKEN